MKLVHFLSLFAVSHGLKRVLIREWILRKQEARCTVSSPPPFYIILERRFCDLCSTDFFGILQRSTLF